MLREVHPQSTSNELHDSCLPASYKVYKYKNNYVLTLFFKVRHFYKIGHLYKKYLIAFLWPVCQKAIVSPLPSCCKYLTIR